MFGVSSHQTPITDIDSPATPPGGGANRTIFKG